MNPDKLLLATYNLERVLAQNARGSMQNLHNTPEQTNSVQKLHSVNLQQQNYSSLKPRGGIETLPLNTVRQNATNSKNASQSPRAVDAADRVADHVTDSGQMVDTCLRADIELSRIALGLKAAPCYRLWLVLHDLSRGGRQGFRFGEMLDMCQQLKVQLASRTLRRLIEYGIGTFWNVDRRTDTIYPASYIHLCQRLILAAAKAGLHDIYESNGIGCIRDMFLDVSGTNARFEAHIIEGWYAAKNDPTISRMTLCAIFNIGESTLIRLEKAIGITITRNTAETLDPADVPLSPDGDKPRGDVKIDTDRNGNTRYTFNLPNTYHAGRVRQHNRRGQGRAAAGIVKQLLESDQLTGIRAAGGKPRKLNRIVRSYCKDDKAVKHSRRRGNTNTLYAPDRPGLLGSVVWRVYSPI